MPAAAFPLRHARLIAAALLAGSSLPALAVPPQILSTFDSGDQGWLLVDVPSQHVETPATAPVTFDPGYGNPAGSLRVAEGFYDTGISAPARYLGDRTAYYGGTLEYDIHIRYTDAVPYWAVVLNGGTTSLFYVATPPALNQFEHRVVPLATSPSWHLGTHDGPQPTEAQMLQVLGNLTGIYILTEWHTGDDDTSVDNIGLQNGYGSLIDFTASRFSRNEDDASGYGVLRVSRTGDDLSQAASVHYATVAGTAGEGVDYLAASGTLRWAAGQGGTRSIRVTLVNDSLDENAEELRVQLSAPAGAGLGALPSAALRILDDDAPPAVSLATATRAVTEGTATGGTLVKLRVDLDAPSGRRVTVPFSVAYETAGADDLVAVGSSPLVFAAGQTTAYLRLTVAADAVAEGNETLRVDLGTPVNATLGTIASTRLTIRNDD